MGSIPTPRFARRGRGAFRMGPIDKRHLGVAIAMVVSACASNANPPPPDAGGGGAGGGADSGIDETCAKIPDGSGSFTRMATHRDQDDPLTMHLCTETSSPLASLSNPWDVHCDVASGHGSQTNDEV